MANKLIEIFVFGSNESGIHGAGSAKAAYKKHGAVWGKGVGFAGRSYAIPTKDRKLQTLPIDNIAKYVNDFKTFATAHPEYIFNIVKIGCGLAGYSEAKIAPLFCGSSENCKLPTGWREFIARINDNQ